MEVKASLKHLRMSARKVRLVTDLVLGMDTEQAQAQLKFLNKRAASIVLKLINSALANAENNLKLEKSNLYIKSIFVDSGPTLKRWLPRAHGRATPLKKRTSHITVILDERTPSKAKTTTKIAPEVDKKGKVGKIEKVEPIGSETIKQEKVESPKDLDKPFVEEEKKEAEGAGSAKPVQKEETRKGWQDKHKTTGRTKGLGGAINKIFRRKSF